MMLDDATVQELVEAVRANSGLRQAIVSLGLPLKPTLKWLKEHRRDVFKRAHEEKVNG